MEIHFQELERSLGLPPDPEDEDPGKTPDFPGVVGAMVAEFQWDLERQGMASELTVERLQPFAEYTRAIGAFEDLTRRDVISFCCFWTLEQGLFKESNTALETVQALEQFTQWAQDEHEMPLHEDCKSLLGDLQNSLPRIVQLNQCIVARPAGDPDEAGQLFSVDKSLEQGSFVLLDRNGNQYTTQLPDELGQAIQPGDHLRADISMEGLAQVFCVYPPQASELNA